MVLVMFCCICICCCCSDWLIDWWILWLVGVGLFVDCVRIFLLVGCFVGGWVLGCVLGLIGGFEMLGFGVGLVGVIGFGVILVVVIGILFLGLILGNIGFGFRGVVLCGVGGKWMSIVFMVGFEIFGGIGVVYDSE